MGRRPYAKALEEVEALRALNRFGEAKKVAREALSNADSATEGVLRGQLALTKATEGDTSVVQKLLAAEVEAPLYARALAHAAVGQTDAAFEALHNVEEWSLGNIVALRYMHPIVFDSLREDPRYEELIQKINQQWGLNPDGTIPEEKRADSV